MPNVRSLGRIDEERAVATLTLAFSTDPVCRWLFPDPHQYFTYFPPLVRALSGSAFDHGTGFAVDDFRGVALWLPPGGHSDDEAAVAVFDQGVREQEKEAAFALLEKLGPFHPEVPHWYLSFIGVDLVWQGRGYGASLLAHALALTDEQHLPAYLESSNERNIPLYERCGFRLMDKIEAGDSPPFWPMLREAR